MTNRKQIRFLRDSTDDDCLETIYSGVGLAFAKGYLANVTLPEEMEFEGDFEVFNENGVLINCDSEDLEGAGPRQTPAPEFPTGGVDHTNPLHDLDQYFGEIPHHLEGDLWEHVQ